MFCGKCGTEAKPGARFCTKCGAPIAASEHARPDGQSAIAETSGTTVATRKTTNTIIYAATAACLVAFAVLVGILVMHFANKQPLDQSERTQSTSPTTVQFEGKTVEALQRPSLYDKVAGESLVAADTPTAAPYQIQPHLTNVTNVDDFYLQDDEKSILETNGFSVTVGNAGDEFFELYERNRYNLYPSFVTVDSMMHTYHLYFSHLMKTTERTSLTDALSQISTDMLSQSEEQASALQGTEWENAALRNEAFFGVAAKLLDPSASIPANVQSAVEQEVSSIQEASGVAPSAINGSDEDYSQYKPRGYYEGDEVLERYFRAMMWYGRMNFKQADEDLDRSALLMTLALENGPRDSWESVYTITSFFAGASDDCGFYEYYPLAQAAYGDDVKVSDLAGNSQAWDSYHALTAQMEPPAINSVVVYDTGEDHNATETEKGFRFMGQRFSIDASIFQQLIYSQVGENANGQKRMLPNALDIPAALGSDEALSILEEKGETGYKGYSDHMQGLRSSISDDDANLWNASLYSQWLHTLNPLLEEKGDGYPSFMQSKEWTRKNLQTYLGSYTELKHDTGLYSKQVIAEMGGGPDPRDDRGYVEPAPRVFERLALLTKATALGLSDYGMISDDDRENLGRLEDLASQLATIADKELRDELPTEAEFDLIREYGGSLEHFWKEVYKDEATSDTFKAKEFPAAIVTDVATDPNGSVLELGTGRVSTMLVVVPIDGDLRLARGSVFSFYQFEQPLSNRLTDSEWREIMNTKDVEDWTLGFQRVMPSAY